MIDDEEWSGYLIAFNGYLLHSFVQDLLFRSALPAQHTFSIERDSIQNSIHHIDASFSF